MMRWRKYGEMTFWTSSNANRHIPLSVGVDGKDEGEFTGTIHDSPPHTCRV